MGLGPRVEGSGCRVGDYTGFLKECGDLGLGFTPEGCRRLGISRESWDLMGIV